LENEVDIRNMRIRELENDLRNPRIKSPEEVVVLREQIIRLTEEKVNLENRVQNMSPGDMEKLIRNIIAKEKEIENVS